MYIVLLLMLMPFSSFCSWAENMLQMLSPAEKTGQLIAARIEHEITPQELEALLIQYHVGAIIPLQYWTFEEQMHATGIIKNTPTKITPLILGDAEWGINMHIPEIPAFPKGMTLGALDPDGPLLYNIGYAIGMQCRAIGMHINLAPVLDVNTDACNPVIGMRSFGETERAVTTDAMQFARGLINAGIIPCLKHFPGHGNTHTDPHITLPIITSKLDTQLICPFFDVLQKLPCAVMVGHIAYPALEPDGAIKPASISSALVTEYLCHILGHSSLIISDALNMGALSAYGDPGEIALQALKAGIDILLCPPDIEAVITRILHALETGEYSEKALDAHVLKVLQTKELLGLHEQKKKELPPLELYEDLIQQAYDSAATATYGILENYTDLKTYKRITLGKPTKQLYPNYEKLDEQTPLLVYLYPGNYKTHRLSNTLRKEMQEIAAAHPGSVVLLFGSPYCLIDIPEELSTLVLYEDVPYTQVTAEKIFGGKLVPHGKLPVTIKK